MSAQSKDYGLVSFSPSQLRKLNRPVSEKHVHVREVEGRRLAYIDSTHAITLANEIFGFAGWDRTTIHLERVHEKARPEQIVCGYTALVRLTVRTIGGVVTRDGTGWGWGSSRTVSLAHEKAIKAAETDATKRALLTFGPQFGLTINDKGRAPSPRRMSLYASDGSRLADDLSAEGFSTGLRQLIEKSTSADELEQLAKMNDASIAELRTHSPAIEGTHFADLLLRLVKVAQNRYSEPKASTTLSLGDEGALADGSTSAQLSRIGDGPKVDKSILLVGNEKRIRDKAHLRKVSELPCLVCGRQPSHAHHLKFAQRRGISQKVSDEFVVPLCAIHHSDLHRASQEERWWKDQGTDPLPVAQGLWAATKQISNAS